LGFSYEAKTLSELHLTAKRFKPADRNPDLAFDAHRRAGNPENLHRAVKELHAMDRPASSDNIRWLMAEWRKRAEKDRHKKKAEAKEKVKAASKKKAGAGRRKLAASSDDEKQQAQADFEKAKEEVKEAIQEFQLIPTEPIGHDEALDPEAMPAKNDLELLALCLKVETNARLMLKTIEKDAEALGPELDRVASGQINQIIKRYVEIQSAVETLLRQVRKHGFKIVEGGVA
jgi:hypothetical protein